jgi:arabinofuranosyltransferase
MIGMVLYLGYIVYIGGDFMTGRFLVAPCIFAVIIIAQQNSFHYIKTIVLVSCLSMLSVYAAPFTILSGATYGNHVREYNWGIADERNYYFSHFGFITTKGVQEMNIENPFENTKKSMSVKKLCGGIGRIGYISGPFVHLIDNCGLTDPLLARLPAYYSPDWRIGHFHRVIPQGYEESVISNENHIKDPVTRKYYDAIRSVTRGPLLSTERFKNILRLNLGLIKKPDSMQYKFPTSTPDYVY